MSKLKKIEAYLNDRIQFKIGLYFKLAKRNLCYYRLLSIVALLSGSIVPVLINSSFLPEEVNSLAATFLSLMVVASIGIESVFNFRQQYRNYKNSEDLLRREKSLFEANAGPYTQTEALNYKLLVERVEAIIIKERDDTALKITEYKSQKTE